MCIRDSASTVTSNTASTTFTTDAVVSSDVDFILLPAGMKTIGGTSGVVAGQPIGSNDKTAKTIAVYAKTAASVKALADYNANQTPSNIDAFVAAFNGITLDATNAFYAATNASQTDINALLNAKTAVDAYNAYKADQSSAAKLATFQTAYGKTTAAAFSNYIADATQAALAAKVAVAADKYAAMDILSGGSTLNTAVAAWNAFYTTPNATNWAAFKTAYDNTNQADFATAVGNKASLAVNVYNAASAGEAARLVDADKSSGGGTTGNASVEASIFATVDASASIEANSAASTANAKDWLDTKYAELDLVFRADNNAAANPPSTGVYIWAEESGRSKQATDALKLNIGTVETNFSTHCQTVYYVPASSLTAGSNTLKAAFVRGGTYTIKASFANPTVGLTLLNESLKSVAVLKTVANKTAITCLLYTSSMSLLALLQHLNKM